MNYSDIGKVHSLKCKVDDLLYARNMITGGSGLGVTIQSTYQDDEFVNNVRQPVIDELNRRIEKLKEELSDLGVVFDD